jgi:hypothetical protein
LTNKFVTVLAVSPDGANLFAGTEGDGVLRSTNKGASWTAVNTGLTNTTVYALTVSGTSLLSGTSGGVFLSTNNGTSWIEVNTGLTNKYVRALATSGTNLFAGTGGGVWRRPLSEMVPLVIAPITPTLSSPGDAATGVPVSTTLTWNPVTGATTYHVQVSSAQSFAAILVDDSTLTTTSKTIGLLSNNTTYYWRVSASNAGGTSAYSPTRSFTTIVALPASPTLAAPADSAINLPLNTTVSWNAVTGATMYHLQVSTSSSFSTDIVDDTTLTDPTKAIGPLSLASTYYWKVRAKNAGGFGAFSAVRSFKTIRTALVEQLGNGLPTVYSLSQNYPNPFNPSTNIQFSIPNTSFVSLKVFNVLGAEIATLADENKAPGTYQVAWDANGYPSGVYLYRLIAGGKVLAGKMNLLK